MIAKLVAVALRQHPYMAARWQDDRLVPATGFHLGIAVDTEEGLFVPVVRNVESLSLAELASRSRELIDRARIGNLTAADMQGGVFTITNLGAYGIDAFTPVISYPETAILGVGAIRPVALCYEGQCVARDTISLSLTFDHFAMDGAPAARFLQTLCRMIERAKSEDLGSPNEV
jgi:pyruvate dehydrogenase E2 component (dihydrolipoamide acetyltransferase)